MLRQLQIQLYGKYKALPERDQRAALILAVALIPALLYFALVFPVQRAHARLTTELQAKEVDLAWMQESVARLGMMKGSGGGQMRQGQSLSQVISDSAPRHQLQISRIQPRDNNEIQVWLEDTKFENILRWLHQCETDYGLAVTNMNITVGKTPGHVKVQVKFRG